MKIAEMIIKGEITNEVSDLEIIKEIISYDIAITKHITISNINLYNEVVISLGKFYIYKSVLIDELCRRGI